MKPYSSKEETITPVPLETAMSSDDGRVMHKI